jgi:hypothetical protein
MQGVGQGVEFTHEQALQQGGFAFELTLRQPFFQSALLSQALLAALTGLLSLDMEHPDVQVGKCALTLDVSAFNID